MREGGATEWISCARARDEQRSTAEGRQDPQPHHVAKLNTTTGPCLLQRSSAAVHLAALAADRGHGRTAHSEQLRSSPPCGAGCRPGRCPAPHAPRSCPAASQTTGPGSRPGSGRGGAAGQQLVERKQQLGKTLRPKQPVLSACSPTTPALNHPAPPAWCTPGGQQAQSAACRQPAGPQTSLSAQGGRCGERHVRWRGPMTPTTAGVAAYRPGSLPLPAAALHTAHAFPPLSPCRC